MVSVLVRVMKLVYTEQKRAYTAQKHNLRSNCEALLDDGLSED